MDLDGVALSGTIWVRLPLPNSYGVLKRKAGRFSILTEAYDHARSSGTGTSYILPKTNLCDAVPATT